MVKPAQLPAGFRDWDPEVMGPKREIIAKVETVFKRYGFVPLETPGVELMSTLTGKGGAVDKQILRVSHGAKDDWGLRFDLTVPLARWVADKQPPLPFKRYQMGYVWRGEKPQKGRLREFLQCDADIVGSQSAFADAEIAAMIADIMVSLEVRALVKINNRRILDALAETAGITDPSEAKALVGMIDKIGKVSQKEIIAEAEKICGEKGTMLVAAYLKAKDLPSLEKLLGKSAAFAEGADNISRVLAILGKYPHRQMIVFDPTLARGLDYYTGIVYEAVLVDAPSVGSVSGGGRFDKLIAQLGGPDLPAVGASIGVDRLLVGLQQLGKLEKMSTPTQILVVNFPGVDSGYLMSVAADLRNAGLATELFLDERRVGDQFRYANKKNVPWVVVVGPEEKERGVVKIRDMVSGEEREFNSLLEMVRFINNAFNRSR